MSGHDIACLVADARRDISDADRCLMLHLEPSVGQLHRRLREVTDALAVLSTPPADDVRKALARTIFIASEDFAYANRMAAAWDGPGQHGRARWFNYADAILADPRLNVRLRDTVTEALCERVSPETGHEEEGDSCVAHNMPWEECREGRADALVREVASGDFEDRGWMIDALERAASLLAAEVRPHGTVTDASGQDVPGFEGTRTALDSLTTRGGESS